MRISLLFLLLFLSIEMAYGQSVGDYRTRSEGRWSQAVRWQVWVGSWQNITSATAGVYQNVIPSNSSGVITLNHDIAVYAATSFNELVVNSGVVLTITTPMTAVQEAGKFTMRVNAGSTVVNQSTINLSGATTNLTTVNGLIIDNGTIINSSAALLIFASGSTYQHTLNGGGVPTATWNAASTCSVTGITNGTYVSNLNQTFGNFTWNSVNQRSIVNLAGIGSIAGDFTVASTGTGELRLKNGGAGYNLSIAGNFNHQAGRVVLGVSNTTTSNVTISGGLNISGGTFTLGLTNNAAMNIFIAGNFAKTAGTITRGTGTGLGTIRFNGASQTYSDNGVITSPIHFLVENGANLNLGTSALTGTGTFTAVAGSTIQLGSTAGAGAIQSNTIAGNIRVSGARTYQNGSTFVFSGSASQFMGAGHPANVNVVVNNTDWVFLLQDQAINGSLDLTLGALAIGTYILQIGGNFSHNPPNGMLAIIRSSSLVINGAGTFPDLAFARYQVDEPRNPINNLTIDRPGATIRQSDDDLTVAGDFIQASGNYSFTATGPKKLRLTSLIQQAPGTSVIGTANSSVFIGGTGVIQQPSLSIGGTLDSLSMDRTGATFTEGAALTVTNLKLGNGTINPSSLITMASNGTVRREFGSVTSALAAQTSYNVIYGNAFNVTTGPELPTNATALNDLTINNQFNVTQPQGAPPYTVTLAAPVEVNGTLSIVEGTFSTQNNAVTIGEDFLMDSNGSFQPGTSNVTFDGGAPQAISTLASVTLYDLTVNQSPTSSVTVSPGTVLNIQNGLIFTSSSTFNAGVNQMTLLSSSTSTAYVGPLPSGAVVNGSIIAQRHLPNSAGIRAWRYLSTPVVGAFVSDWQAEFPISGTFSNPSTGPGIVANSPSMYRYDETFVSGGSTREARYRAYPASGSSTVAPLVNGLGYSVYIRQTTESIFDTRGTLRQGSFTLNLTNSGGANGGWHLLGNPYAAPIDWDAVAPDVSGGVGNAIYFTDNTNNGGSGGTVSYVNGIGVPASYSGLIAQGQAFWVRTTGGPGSVTFQESDKAPGQAGFFREGVIPNVLRVVVNGQGVSDEMVLRLHDEGTDKFDSRFDAVKFESASLNLSSLASTSEKLVINTISSRGCDQLVPILIEGAKSGSFTLDFTGFESFEASAELSLKDKVENKIVALTANRQYSFSSSNPETLKNRFEIIVSQPPIETALFVRGTKVCEDSEQAFVKIENSQLNVTYSGQWNGRPMVGQSVGNGGTVEIALSVEELPQGEQEITISAQREGCDMQLLLSKATILVLNKGSIAGVQDGTICNSGVATLKAASSSAASYNWYEDVRDSSPIAGQSAAEFATPVLTKSKSYYVAAVNELGCEGDRVEVKAIVNYSEAVTLNADGMTLVSNYEVGNQWYLDGEVIPGATSKTYEVSASGNYSVTVVSSGCKMTSEGREMVVTGLEEEGLTRGIQLYPNPTADKVVIEVRSTNSNVEAKLLNTAGVELNKQSLTGSGDLKTGEFGLQSLPDGVYLVRIKDGPRVITKRITKVK